MSKGRDRGGIEPEVREFVRKVKENFNAKVILFGSRIRGDYLLNPFVICGRSSTKEGATWFCD